MRYALVLLALCALLAGCRQDAVAPRPTPVPLPAFKYTPTPVRVPLPSPSPSPLCNTVPQPGPCYVWLNTPAPGQLPDTTPPPADPSPTPVDPPPVSGGGSACVSGTGAAVIGANCATPSPPPSPTPTPTVAPYAPSMMYVGNSAGEGGLCGGTGPYTPCTSGANIRAADVRWIEGFIGDTHLDPATGDWAAPGPYCTTVAGSCAVGYSSFISNSCNLTQQSTVYSAITGAVTTGFQHDTGQPTSGTAYLHGGPSGTCGSFTTRVWQYPADTTGQTIVFNDWFQTNAGGDHTINGRTWYKNFDDNFELVPSVSGSYSAIAAQEYLLKWPDAAQNSQRDLGKWLAAMSPYLQITNGLTTGGGHYGLCTAAVGSNCADGAHASVGTTGSQAYMRFNYLACDNDLTGNWVAALAERAFFTGGPSGNLNYQGYMNGGVLTNTLSWMYNDANCGGVNILDLEPSGGNGTTLWAAREVIFGFRLLLSPNGYDGQSTSRAFMDWLYIGCSSCHNLLPIYPEYMAVGVQLTPAISTWTYGQDTNTDGNGCGPHDTGGMASLLIGGTCSLGVDEQGHPAGVYHRSGELIVDGVDKGHFTVLWNDTKSTVTIQSSWCAFGCSNLPYVVAPTGNEQQYLNDNPAAGTLNPNGTGHYGTTAAPATIPPCEVSSVAFATSCIKVLVQNQ